MVRKLDIFKDPLLDRQIGEIVRAVNPQEWTAPTLLNNWANYSSSYNAAGYYKHLDRVYLRGLVANGIVGTTIFQLPVGYRPAHRELIATICTAPNHALARIDVDTSGNVVSMIGGGVGNWVALDNLSFRVA